MTASFMPLHLPEDVDALVDLVSGQRWPFHVATAWTEDEVRRRAAAGYWDEHATRTFWVLSGDARVGLLRLEDVGEGTPLFDLRLEAAHRGRGLGTAAVRWLSGYLFGQDPQLQRIEATTRADNAAMRAVLERCCFVKEAHYRRAWRAEGGLELDSIGYGLLRSDWARGVPTPVRWDG